MTCHIEKPGQCVDAWDNGPLFMLCGAFCTFASDRAFDRAFEDPSNRDPLIFPPGFNFVSLPGPWKEEPDCAMCIAICRGKTARTKRRATTETA